MKGATLSFKGWAICSQDENLGWGWSSRSLHLGKPTNEEDLDTGRHPEFPSG